ncbi:uncharacterized protein [Halyomorpha halys]|uniref:uncharacterized protein isoform X2 n=1 Tax=Halyomorpha halys TaxID=286706 RepID=UPI0006D4F028|nr:uncharacterized protein LOC106688544 [Halyomorpha halys]
MLQELICVALVSVIGAALYVLFVRSLTWAVELRGSIINSDIRSQNGSVLCHTCGTNFMENSTVEDGRCQICGKKLCSRCGLEWICPRCYKKRTEREKKKSSDFNDREILAAAKIMKVLKMKGYATESAQGINRQACIKQNHINHILETSYNYDFGGKDIIFPEYGVDFPKESANKCESEHTLKTNNWEGNWLFKKKGYTEVFKPPAMFVPSSKQKSKAQIGGIDIDDLSDLSEYSDSELENILN